MKYLFLFFTVGFIMPSSIAQTAKSNALDYLKLSGMESSFNQMKAQFLEKVTKENQADFDKEFDVIINRFYDKYADLLVAFYDETTISETVKKMKETKEVLKLQNLCYEKSLEMGSKMEMIGQEFGLGMQGLIAKYIPEEE